MAGAILTTILMALTWLFARRTAPAARHGSIHPSKLVRKQLDGVKHGSIWEREDSEHVNLNPWVVVGIYDNLVIIESVPVLLLLMSNPDRHGATHSCVLPTHILKDQFQLSNKQLRGVGIVEDLSDETLKGVITWVESKDLDR